MPAPNLCARDWCARLPVAGPRHDSGPAVTSACSVRGLVAPPGRVGLVVQAAHGQADGIAVIQLAGAVSLQASLEPTRREPPALGVRRTPDGTGCRGRCVLGPEP